MSREERLNRAEARAGIYRLLAEAYRVPGEEVVGHLRGLDRETGDVCARLAALASSETGLEALKVDHARLFIGPFKLLAPPYGSIYLEGRGRLMGDSTVDARARYAEEGLDLALKEVADHVTIELEFMSVLIDGEIEAVRGGEGTGADGYAEKQRRFLEEHLGAWIFDFTANVSKSAETDFYRGLAEVTEGFIRDDAKYLNLVSAG